MFHVQNFFRRSTDPFIALNSHSKVISYILYDTEVARSNQGARTEPIVMQASSSFPVNRYRFQVDIASGFLQSLHFDVLQRCVVGQLSNWYRVGMRVVAGPRFRRE